MSQIYATFDRAGELYSRWFSDWLHIHFIIRTVLLLLAIWLAIYIAAQLFQYVIAPVLLLIFYHTIFRAWNYFAVETPQEWIYIKYFSRDKPQYREKYLRLCDKVKRNRQLLSNLKYGGMIRRAKWFTLRAMIIFGVISLLWVAGFGLHGEYAVPAMVQIGTGPPEVAATEYENGTTETEQPAAPGETVDYTPAPQGPREPPLWLDPYFWPTDEDIVLRLNELGQPGARLRDGPGIVGRNIIEILWQDDEMQFLHSYYPDSDVQGLYWLRVRSPHGTEGYISSQLVER